MRKVVEYLRKKNNLTIEDLVVEICCSTMYYKYLSGEKNMSEKNLTLIKERLGADIITKEEIEEFKIELNKIIHKLIRYYNSRKEFEEDFSSLLEIEPQLLLNEELVIPYGLLKMNYFLSESNVNDGILFSEILEDYYDKMSIQEKAFFLHLKIFFKNYLKLPIKEDNDKLQLLLDNNRYMKEFGRFYMSLVYNYLKLKDRVKALLSIEVALELFQRDMNFVGLVKAYNMKAFMLGEDCKFDLALELLLPNYENAKKVATEVEVFVSLTNIISCYLGLADKKNARKYWKIFKKRLEQKNGDIIIKAILNNSSVNLLSNFEYYGMNKELDELIEMLEFYKVRGNHVIDKLVEYYKINNTDERIAFIEKYLLPTLVGKVHFTYCKWMLDMCIIYFRKNRKYKKATLFETEYLKQFKEYYFK